jgi:hypothetical protein
MKTITRAKLGVLLLAVAAAGCSRQVVRVAPEQAFDLSGRWNDVDSRLVADTLIRQSFGTVAGNWAMRHTQAHGGTPPTLIVGTIRNRSMEHIPVSTFVKDLERAYVQSGLVRVVADQDEHAAANTRARVGKEQGANYMLQGEIESIEDRERGRSVVFYQVDLALVDLESNAKVWVGQHKIKKFIERPRLGL